VAVADIAKAAIIMPFSLFLFNRMSFGLRNTGMTFLQLMYSLFGGIPCAFVYRDDILIPSLDPVSHQQYLVSVLSILQ
jgi:hypothetical protein